MLLHKVKVYPSKIHFPKKKQLAWKIAEISSDNAKLNKVTIEMVINRIIDNASVAIASLNRKPVISSREMALKHPRKNGATLFGVNSKLKFDCEWAAWSNGTAVRELDFHDTFLAADYSHPGDNIPPLISVAQQNNKSGLDLLKGIITAYEVQVNLVKGICLHKHKVDHIAHLGPSVAGGLGAMLKLNTEIIYQAVQQALHTTISTRQSRKGEISSWKAYAPAHAGKLAIEAVDRAMRGEGAPSPIYEGEDSIIARILDGKKANYKIPLPKKGESKKAILETYTKEYSAEYQSQALIDLAKKLKTKISDLKNIKKIDIFTSHHTHYVIGTGANDPQKMDPNASRETLDHSIMYIFAVALEDGDWHHVKSYTKARANRKSTIKIWRSIKTYEDKKWTKKYHDPNPKNKSFGARVVVTLNNDKKISEELDRADAHPYGARPFKRQNYINKFLTLTEGIIDEKESDRFLRRVDFDQKLKSNKILRVPGAYNPLTAKLIEEIGYDAVYVSGGVMANDLGFPDIGLTTLQDVSTRSYLISRVTNLPTIVDIDTGFKSCKETIETFEHFGITGVHLEDQIERKRCGHLDNKELISTDMMVKKIKECVSVKKDNNFKIIARSDAKSVEGIDKMIERCKAYIDAGAEIIFPEALTDEKDFEKVRKELSSYLLANMTEFGKSKLFNYKELENFGFNIVIYPVTTQRLAMKNVEDGLRDIYANGHQNNIIDKMQTRKRLYELVDYEKYNSLDEKIYNFSTEGHE